MKETKKRKMLEWGVKYDHNTLYTYKKIPEEKYF